MAVLDFLRGGTPEDRFAKMVMAELRRAGWPGEPRYDRERFAIVLDDSGTMFLHNAFREWQAAESSERQRAELRKMIAAMFERKASGTFAEDEKLLLPVIRNRSHLENQWLDPTVGLARDALEGACRPLCGALAILAAVDRPNSIALAMAKQLREWLRTLDEVLPIAIENLREKSPCRFERDDRGFYISDYRDYHDASRILLPHLFAQIPLRGDPVAVVISRASIVVAGSEDSDAIAAMAAVVEEQMTKEPRLISVLPLMLREGAWQPFDPATKGLLPLHLLRAKQQLWDYAEQKMLLEKHLEAQGRDVFVAPLEAKVVGERAPTWATWPHDVPTLLPEADIVALFRGEDRPILARTWSDVVAVCGPFPTESGTYPPRHFVERGPSDEAWETLAACEHPPWFPELPAQRWSVP